MGGTVAETIRKENGEVIKMARKTGAYNWLIFSKEFNNGQLEQAIDDHVEKFMEMKRDFDSGQPYDFPMSAVYGWCQETAPVDYGLVVIDFQNKKIHSMQSYDSPGKMHLFQFSPYLRNEEQNNYNFLAENNMLEVYDNKMNYIGDVHTVFGSKNTYESIQKEIKESHNPLSSIKSIFNKNKLNHMNIVLIPKFLKEFQFITYDEEPNGLINYLTNLRADGFIFNEDEINLWKEYFDDFAEFATESLIEEEIDALSDKDYQKLSDKFRTDFVNKIDDIVKK